MLNPIVMERVFTTYFEFHGKKYATRVREYSSPRDFSLQIEVPDESLLYLLPDGKVVYNSRVGLQTGQPKDNVLAHELVGCIVRSVEPHLF
jgi:hypothetical protein